MYGLSYGAGLVRSGIGHRRSIERGKGRAKARRAGDRVIIEPHADGVVMPAAVGYLDQNAHREHVPSIELGVHGGAEGDGDFFGLIGVAGNALDILGLARGDHHPILAQFRPQIEIGALIVAVLEPQPHMQRRGSRQAQKRPSRCGGCPHADLVIGRASDGRRILKLGGGGGRTTCGEYVSAKQAQKIVAAGQSEDRAGRR